MSSALEIVEQYAVKKNASVEAFLNDVNRIKAAIDKDRVSGRSPVRLDSKGYSFDLLGETLVIDGKSAAIGVLDKLTSAAYDANDTEYRAAIEKAYPAGSEEPKPRRGRKPKNA